MKIVDREDFKMYIKIDDCLSPDDTKVLYFIREEFDRDENVIS